MTMTPTRSLFRLLVLLLLVAVPGLASAAVSKVGTTTKKETLNGDATQTQTTAYTVPATSDLLLVRFIYNSNNASNMVTTVTYNGVALTRAGQHIYTLQTSRALEIWYLVAPTIDGVSHNVSIDLASTETFNICLTFVDSWTGVDPVTPFGTFSEGENLAGGTAQSLTATSVSGDFVVDLISCFSVSAQSFSEGAGQDVDNSELNANLISAATSRETATTTTTTMSWTTGQAGNSQQVAVNLKPYVAAGTSKPNLMLLGVGPQE